MAERKRPKGKALKKGNGKSGNHKIWEGTSKKIISKKQNIKIK